MRLQRVAVGRVRHRTPAASVAPIVTFSQALAYADTEQIQNVEIIRMVCWCSRYVLDDELGVPVHVHRLCRLGELVRYPTPPTPPTPPPPSTIISAFSY